jgi:hypothetical protein
MLLCAACTSSASGDASTSDQSGSSASSTGLSVSSVALTSASPSSQPSTPTSATPATSSSQPWPADYTPDQIAAVQTAIETYKNAVRVTDEAYADPSRADLEPFIRQYIADPRANQVITAAQGMAADRNHVTGSSVVEVEAARINANEVILDVCLDTSNGDLIDDATGNSIRAQLPIGPRVKQTANVYDYGSPHGWLLSELIQSNPAQAC